MLLNKLKKNFSLKHDFLYAFFLYLFVRIPFISNYPFFYDSPEYFKLSLNNCFFCSVLESHESVHPIYLFFIQFFQNIIPKESYWNVSLVSLVFSLLSFMFFYLLVKELFNKRTAIYSSLVLCFIPHLWLLDTNIMHEAVDWFFLISSSYFLVKLVKGSGKKYFPLSVVFLSLALVNFTGSALWFLGVLGFATLCIKTKKQFFLSVLVFIAASFLGLGILYLVLEKSGISGFERIGLLFENYGSITYKNWNPVSFLRTARNIVYVLMEGYSPASFVIVPMFLIYAFIKKQKKLLLFSFLFLLAFFISGKFWYGGFFGRYSSFFAYFLALCAGYITENKLLKKLYFAFFLVLIVQLGFFMKDYSKDSVFEIQKELIKSVPIKNEDVIVLSDFQRPQLAFSNAFYIGPDLRKKEEMEIKMEKYLKEGKNVYITEQARYFPYWQYDGQRVHIITKGNKNKALLNNFLSDKKLIEVSNISEYPLLKIYKIEEIRQ